MREEASREIRKKWSKKGKNFKKKSTKKEAKNAKNIYMGGGNAEFGFGQDEDDEEEDLWANVDARFVFFVFVGCFFVEAYFSER